jgi:L-asparaginase
VTTTQPRILFVFTGGTISMRIVPGRGAVPARSGREILADVPGLERYATIVCEDFDRIPGPHWTPRLMLDLGRRLDEALAAASFDGAVVTHGTDTLEESAYVLDLVLRTDKPVVLTGAMKTADDPVRDGPGNVIAATRTAADPEAAGRGVLVVLDNTVHAARHVVKAHTESFSAFSSGEAGAEAVVDLDRVHWRFAPYARERIATDRIEPEVALVPAPVGSDDRFLRHALATGAKGIVVEGLGRGNVPPAMAPAIAEAVRAGVPVVIASRCRNGRTAPRYGYDGGGSGLKASGAIFSGGLTASKARMKLMLLLGAGRSVEEITASFESPAR